MIPFLKGNGTGNDFVVVRGEDLTGIDRSELAKAVCHRHFGVGADGLLILSEPSMGVANFLYEMINPDGTSSGRCGNGMRVAVLAWERMSGKHTRQGSIQIEDRTHRFEKSDDVVSVELGQCFAKKAGPQEIVSILPDSVAATHCVDVGNPHLILVTESLPSSWASISKDLEVHPVFPNRTNVHWVIPGGEVTKVFTWERGAGETLACGSGACAIAFAMPDQSKFLFPGGILRVELTVDGIAVLSGEAEVTFSGEFPTLAEH